MNSGKLHIPKIVITGGPCGGKSSAMPFLYERLSENGYFAILVPEAPTILMNAGHLPHGGDVQLRTFQERVIDLILVQEKEAHEYAIRKGHPKPIIVCDRGIMDTKAYTGETMFNEILASRGLEVRGVLERYHAVLHMQSTAVGAEEHYTKANNVVRLENLDEARDADARTLDAWSIHPRFAVIGNEEQSFERKLQTLWARLFEFLA